MGLGGITQSVQSVILICCRPFGDAVFLADFTFPIGIIVVAVIVTLTLITAEIVRDIRHAVGIVINVISIGVVLIRDLFEQAI